MLLLMYTIIPCLAAYICKCSRFIDFGTAIPIFFDIMLFTLSSLVALITRLHNYDTLIWKRPYKGSVD